ncbi:hypothetical protein ASD52_27690 [Ensifer sp. Root142]|nr:hypothetical protein ASD52_27690 [Ensifer sp. Root142]
MDFYHAEASTETINPMLSMIWPKFASQQQLMGLRKSQPDKGKNERSGWRLDTHLSAFVRSRYRGVHSNWRKRRENAPIGPTPRGQSGEGESDVIDRLSTETVYAVAASWSPEQRAVDRDLRRSP